jgi:hypothetical protein
MNEKTAEEKTEHTINDKTVGQRTSASISRREFARRAAFASAVASITSAGAVSAELASPNQQSSPPAKRTALAALPSQSPSQTPPIPPAQLPSNIPKLSPQSQAEADARFQSILAQYPDRFSEEQKTDLRRLCILTQLPLDRLRAYSVENGDGPGLYLKPLYEREKKPRANPATASPPASAQHPTAPSTPPKANP